MNPLEILKSRLPLIEKKIGYTFENRDFLTLAFVHRSFINEYRDLIDQNNERLEFLGDSVLGVLVAEYLFKYLPNTPEGELSHLRSRLVEASSCYLYMQKLEIDEYLLLGRGEQMNAGRGRESIVANLFEALLGAIFLDGGMEAAKRFLFKNFSPEIETILKDPGGNWKAQLQDWAQKNFQQPPLYVVLSEEGPDHSKVFTISVSIQDKELGRGVGPSKKEAQQAAAEAALLNLSKDL